MSSLITTDDMILLGMLAAFCIICLVADYRNGKL